ncbi:MAG: hydantoinase [Rhodospirillaceae bacterium]|nr:MAG: hydantoinase [Rhodospirillaceae bacterium]
MGLLINVDNGGTLTDVCVVDGPDVYHAKTLTTPYNLSKCFFEVLKEASKQIYGEARLDKLLNNAESIRYSTTQGTNAVVQKIGPRLGLILRKGKTAAFLRKTESEVQMFDVLVGDRLATLDCKLKGEDLEEMVVGEVNRLISKGANRVVVSFGGANMVRDETRIKRILLQRYPRHLLGAVPVLFSHELIDDGDDRRRTWTGLLNSFLHPAMERFLYNAENRLRDHRTKNPMLIFRNDGNSTRIAKTIALKSYGSGPRGGMEGACALMHHYGIKMGVTMDIGGTTTDIGLVEKGAIREKRRGKVEEIPVSFPLSDLVSIGVGGGSIFRAKGKTIAVGPESVGAAPGPACFGRGGQEATSTDAYLLMGILDPASYFGGGFCLDVDRARAVIDGKIADPLGKNLDAALLAMDRVYEEKIAKAIARYVKKPAATTLLAFGGAGPMNACGIAERVGIREVLIPRMASVFSAFGIGFSDIAHSYEVALSKVTNADLKAVSSNLMERAKRDMFSEGIDIARCKRAFALEYSLKGAEIRKPLANSPRLPKNMKGAKDVRLHLRLSKAVPHCDLKKAKGKKTFAAKRDGTRRILSASGIREDVPVYRLEKLRPMMTAEGPAILEEAFFTCRVKEGWTMDVNENHDVFLRRTGGRST